MEQIRNRLFRLIYLFCLIVLFSCNNSHVKRHRVGQYELEGAFLNDSIPDGLIKYYKAGTSSLIATREFRHGLLNGKSTNYFGNKIIQVINYVNGQEMGFNEIYDSTKGFLKHRDYHYYGRRIGPSFEFSHSDSLAFYNFSNFENEILYSCIRDSLSRQLLSDNIEKLARISVDENIINNQEKLRLFCYLIYPPKATVSYKICYLDQNDRIIDSVKISKSNEQFFWEGYLNYPRTNQNLALIITRYDSTTMKRQSIINYIKQYGQK